MQMDAGSSGGIMIYNAGTTLGDAVSITGDSQGVVALSPLTSGIYSGMFYFQARNATEDVTLAADGSFTIWGTIYAPAATLSSVGNGNATIGSQVITKDLALNGNGNMIVNHDVYILANSRLMSLVE
jgi:hypothetical protein